MRFCGFKPPGWWCFVIGHKTDAPSLHQGPGPQEKATRRHKEVLPARGANAPSPPGAEALPTLNSHQGLAGNRRQGSPRPSPAWGWGSLPVLPPPRANGVGGGPRGVTAGSIGRKRKMSVCPLVTVSVTSTWPEGHSPALPSVHQPLWERPACSAPSCSRGCPSPAPNPKLPLRAPGRSPWRREKVVWRWLLWARLRVPPSSPIYF